MPQPAPSPRHNPKNENQELALQKIRPELNLEKWIIWQPAQSKNEPQTRVLERNITLPNGDRVAAKVEIAPTTKGALTTEDQKTYYALVRHWEDRGRPDSYTAFSLRRIAKLLKKRWGTNVIDSVTASLMRLRGTLLIWENSFYDSSTKETAELIETFNILADLKIIRRKVDGIVNREVGYFRFNDFTLKNLQNNHTKPLLFDVVLGFKSQIAQLLYTHVDLMLAGNQFYERRTRELFEDLGLLGTAYKYPSKRKQMLDPALKELQGVPLSKGGVIASVTLQPTKDEKDLKVVFRKGPASAVAESTDEGREVAPVAPAPAIQLSPIEQQGEELIRYFHQVFFGVKPATIRSRHRDLAASIVAQHGLEVAKYVVDYSRQAAQETKFQIATFGAIAQYVARAVADYERAIKERERVSQQTEEEAARQKAELAELEAYSRAQDRYDQLADQERHELEEKYRAELIASQPTWAQPNAHGDRPLLTSAVKAAIIRHLMREQGRGVGDDTGDEMISSPEKR